MNAGWEDELPERPTYEGNGPDLYRAGMEGFKPTLECKNLVISESQVLVPARTENLEGGLCLWDIFMVIKGDKRSD